MKWSGGPLRVLTAALLQDGMKNIGRQTTIYEAQQLIIALDRTGDDTLTLNEFTTGNSWC